MDKMLLAVKRIQVQATIKTMQFSEAIKSCLQILKATGVTLEEHRL